MSLQHYYESFAERLQTSAHVKTIFGEPIETGGRTIIPVASAAFGFGGGPARKGEGGSVVEAAGGGGGVRTKPLGIIEVTEEKTRFVATTNTWSKGVLGLIIGAGAGYLLASYIAGR